MRSNATFTIAGLLAAILACGGCDSGLEPDTVSDGGGSVSAQALSSPAGIYLANADGSGAIRLTTGNRPSFSPDGRRIAFDRDREVRVIDVHGTGETVLAHGVDAAWSPDGSRIVFAEGGDDFTTGISSMDADGSSVTRLVGVEDLGSAGGWGLGKPAWSPDGKSIAFEHYGNDVEPVQIWVMDADGSDARRLTPRTGVQYAESDPAWSPDGEWIALWSWGYGLAIAQPEGGHSPLQVYRNFPFVSYGTRPAWSPDGNDILFTAGRFGEPKPISIYRVSREQGAWDRPVLVVRDASDPSWSGDGKRLVYVLTGGAR